MLQSISQKEYPEELFYDFGFVIGDEIHHLQQRCTERLKDGFGKTARVLIAEQMDAGVDQTRGIEIEQRVAIGSAMGVVEIITIESDQNVAASFRNGQLPANGFAGGIRQLWDVSDARIIECVDQRGEIGLIAVVVDHHNFPLLKALAQTTGQGSAQLQRPVPRWRDETDQGCRGTHPVFYGVPQPGMYWAAAACS